MSRRLDDLQEIPQDWFYELTKNEEPNESDLESVDIDLYQSECPGLIGNMILELFYGKDMFYYMLMQKREPIGDYGMHWINRWYRCEEQYIHQIKEILNKEDNDSAVTIEGGQAMCSVSEVEAWLKKEVKE
ncbi:MAG: hypothetical protein NC311_08630 [Muribaculaceae bacterium]|nr:hypothetical protein [Muribaculaceae bacterium]MCM1399883.1 hypothetical protein [Clostridium sp.]MCM1460631.1 hypothetical protein [Bacteroides sp.]